MDWQRRRQIGLALPSKHAEAVTTFANTAVDIARLINYTEI